MTISKELAEKQYSDAIKNGLCSTEKAVIFYSKEALNYRLDLLQNIFPKGTNHAIAIKTCNHKDVLSHIVAKGFGLEAASIEEVLLAKEAGAANEKIIFDSPVKTRHEIDKCHNEFPGILLNANSLEELARYPTNFNGKIGLRINPLVNNSGGSYFNVSTKNSKFGVPISKRQAIIDHCLKYQSITCLHFHIGSNLKDLSPNIEAISKVSVLAIEINDLRKKLGIKSKIDTLDIGGGIEFDPKSIELFVESMLEIPKIKDFSLITEYGNFVHKYNSFVVSNIEYVISNAPDLPDIAYIHVGADLFVRKVYSNLNVEYPCTTLHANENTNSQKIKNYNIVGPLCFAGDILFENIKLHEIKEGDKLFIYNIGSNTLSMWSGHCSRELPPFIFC
jgi:diaminopimelate decarboxylase